MTETKILISERYVVLFFLRKITEQVLQICMEVLIQGTLYKLKISVITSVMSIKNVRKPLRAMSSVTLAILNVVSF